MKIIQTDKPLSAYDCVILVDIDPEGWGIELDSDEEKIQNLADSFCYSIGSSLIEELPEDEPLLVDENVEIIEEKEQRSTFLIWVAFLDDTSLFNEISDVASIKINGYDPEGLYYTMVFLKGLAADLDRIIDVAIIGFDKETGIDYFAEKINKIKQVSVKTNPDFIFPTDGWMNLDN